MVIGWVITKSYLSGYTEYLLLSEDAIQWSTVSKNCTILRDRTQAEGIMSQLRADKTPIELVPVEIHI
jgi:hypothetical protein